MNEQDLRGIVEEVVRTLVAKGYLKTGNASASEPSPKRPECSTLTTVGSAGKVFTSAEWAPGKPAPSGGGKRLPCGGDGPLPVECEGNACGRCAASAGATAGTLKALGADRIAVCQPTTHASSVARMVDHTLLKPNATQTEVANLCEEARKYCFASVCVNPSNVAYSAQMLQGSGVKVCTVIGFPLGSTTSTVKAVEARDAIANGAEEIDMVINVGALKSGNDAAVYEDIKAVREATRGKVLKVILETSLLSDEEKVRACIMSKKAGADFVKTSTGFGGGGATVEDVKLMRQTVGPLMGVKASGGIRDAKIADAMIQAGATRLGTSASVAIVSGQAAAGKGY
jgi:deoxyribose-phosphate aldolase